MRSFVIVGSFMIALLVFLPAGTLAGTEPSVLFANKDASFYSQTPAYYFTSTAFGEVLAMGSFVQGDVTNFNPDIQIYQTINIDGSSAVKSWDYFESETDSLGFLVYYIDGGNEAVVLKKNSKLASYSPYCIYQVPVGDEI